MDSLTPHILFIYYFKFLPYLHHFIALLAGVCLVDKMLHLETGLVDATTKLDCI